MAIRQEVKDELESIQADVVIAEADIDALEVAVGERVPVLLDEATASDDNFLTLSNSDGQNYPRLMVEIEGLYPVIDGSKIYMQTSDGNLWSSAHSYALGYTRIAGPNTGDTGVWYNTAVAYLALSLDVQNDATSGLFGEITITNTISTITRYWGDLNWISSVDYTVGTIQGIHVSPVGTRLYEVRFLASANNIMAGSARLWGLPSGS